MRSNAENARSGSSLNPYPNPNPNSNPYPTLTLIQVLLLWGDVQFVATRPDVLCPRPSSILSPWAGDGYTQNARSRRKFRRILEAFMAEDAEDDARLAVRGWGEG